MSRRSRMDGADKGLSKIPELLAPAGSEESLRAALAAGADAVYFGGSAFSNRMRAKNFAGEQLSDAIRLAHSVGAKAHITLNTRVRDREMDDALRLAYQILGGDEEARADAVIIADLGLAAEIRKRFPHAVLHASTQTSMGSPDDCRALYEAGFARLVAPRELNREEIAALCGCSPLEIEIFIHGAHCVSCSGQCLLSYFCGGRSGNRGECAQPCRLPYRVGADDGSRGKPSGFPLSLADMCLAGRIPEVIDTGVASLKIEGRLKSAPYVYGVTSIYRRLLDEGRAADKSEIAALESLFTRGFTDGYFAGRYANMGGGAARENPKTSASPENIAKALNARKKQTDGERESRDAKALTAEFEMKADAPVRFTVRWNGFSATAVGELPQKAAGAPMHAETAAKNLTKCGGTGFSLRAEDIAFSVEDGLWLPVSRLNDLRRRALEEMTRIIGESEPAENGAENVSRETLPEKYMSPVTGKGKNGDSPWILELADASALAAVPKDGLKELIGRFERISVPASEYGIAKRALAGMNAELTAVLPVFPLGESEMKKLLGQLWDGGCGRVLAHTVGQIRAARETGFTADVSFRANITNAAAVGFYRALGCGETGLSPELPCGAVRALGGSCIAYGRIPVMTLARCVLKPGNRSCSGVGGRRTPKVKPTCRGALTDRLGEVFPVFGGADCVNIVYNAKPIWMGDRLGELAGASSLRFLWTDETWEEMLTVVKKYQNGETGEGRRIP